MNYWKTIEINECEDERINNIKNKELFNIQFLGELYQKFCIK